MTAPEGQICKLCLEAGDHDKMRVALNGRRTHLKQYHPDKTDDLTDGELKDFAEASFMKESEYDAAIANEEKERAIKAEVQLRMKQEMERMEAEKKTILETYEAEKAEILEREKLLLDEKQEREKREKALDEGFGKLSYALPPGEWMVNFLETKGIKPSEDEKMMIMAEYREEMPDPRVLEYFLQQNFGMQKPQLTRICKVYDYLLGGYLTYRAKRDRVIDLPRGNIKLPSAPNGETEYKHYLQTGRESKPFELQQSYQNRPDGQRVRSYSEMVNPGAGYSSEHDAQTSNIGGNQGDIAMLALAIQQMATAMTTSLGDVQSKLSELSSGRHHEEQRPVYRGEDQYGSQRPVNDPKVAALEQQVTALVSSLQAMQKDREEEKKEDGEEKKRRELLEQIQRSVAEMINANISPLSERLKGLERELPQSMFNNLGLRDLLDLRKDIREGSMEQQKFEFAKEKYADTKETDKIFKQELMGGITKIGDTIGAAMGEAVTKQLKKGEPIGQEVGEQQVPAQSSGNIIQFPCENCQSTVYADKRMSVATCLKCGQQYQLVPDTRQPQQPSQPAQPKDNPPGVAEGITIVQPGQTEAAGDTEKNKPLGQTAERMGEV